MISRVTARPAIVDANLAEFPIEVGHRRVRDALAFPQAFKVWKNSLQWFMQSTKLTHSLATNVHFDVGAACQVLLCVQLPDTGEGRSEWCCLKTTFYAVKESICRSILHMSRPKENWHYELFYTCSASQRQKPPLTNYRIHCQTQNNSGQPSATLNWSSRESQRSNRNILKYLFSKSRT